MRLCTVLVAVLAMLSMFSLVGLLVTGSPATIYQKGLTDVAEVTEQLSVENDDLLNKMADLQEINLDPIKIKGKEGARSRQLRTSISALITDSEELRAAVGRMWLSEQAATSPADRAAFTDALQHNHRLRTEALKLRHLGSDIHDLHNSLTELKEENHGLRAAFAEFKYQKASLPKELDVVTREVEGLAKQVTDASRKKKQPPNLLNAKNYIIYMSQILSTMSSLHEFGEASAFGKLDIASDVFTDLSPKASSIPSSLEQKLRDARDKFEQLKVSLASKWSQLKSLSEPENIRAVGSDTLAKMNRVLVNVVSKLKEIGQSLLLKRGKTPVDKTMTVLSDKLTVLDTHFNKTWDDLQAEVNLNAIDETLALEMAKDEVQNEPEADVVEEEETGTTVNAPNEVAESTKEDIKPVNAMEPGGEQSSAEAKMTEPPVTDEGKEGKKKIADSKITADKKKKLKDEKKEKKTDKKSEVKGQPDQNNPSKRKDKNKTGARKVEKREANNESKSRSDAKKHDKDKKDNELSRSKSNKDIKGDESKESDKYFKGHYNKDKDGGSKDTKDVSKQKKKLKKNDSVDDGDDDDDDDDDDRKKKSGLRRHWEKPVKKNYFRESTGNRHQFIRRKD